MKKVRFPKIRPEQSLGFLFWQVTNLWQRTTTNALRVLNLTHVQFVILANTAWLTRHGEPATQTMISANAKTDIMMTSKVIRTLEAKGFITREVHRADPRANSVKITDAGVDILEKAFVIIGNVDDTFFGGLTSEHQQQFLVCLTDLITAGQEK